MVSPADQMGDGVATSCRVRMTPRHSLNETHLPVSGQGRPTHVTTHDFENDGALR